MLCGKRFAVIGLAAGILGLGGIGGCGDDSSGPSPSSTDVTVTLSNFAPNSPTQGHYELWISFALLREGPTLRHSEAASAGKFKLDAAGKPVSLSGSAMQFKVSPDDPNAQVQNGKILWQLAVDAFITVEAEGDTGNEPALPGLLAGSFRSGASTLITDFPDAIDFDFSTSMGSFHLATPTTSATTDEAEGVWFATPGGGGASLVLPALQIGTLWTYQAWVQHPTSGVASLGKFLLTNLADNDGAGPLGGTGYVFPGSDFPFGAAGTDLANSTIFVTLEPPGDADGSGPFFFRVLSAPVGGAAPGAVVLMTGVPEGIPGATVTIPRN